jgi:SAM-dependent methyltransferase
MVSVGRIPDVPRVEDKRNRMIPTLCAICGGGTDTELYKESLGRDAMTFARFSARRTPDRVHYRIVRCSKCGLLRSDPIFPEDELSRLYRGSAVTYTEEAGFAGTTYAQYLQKYLPLVPSKDRLLEIGCGNGFFLERAAALGFREVFGVEPSTRAVELAPASIRNNIRNDIFRDGLYPSGYFDVICGFQVFDHMARPNDVLDVCRRLLRPGGLALFINHDARAWSNRLLGERSPIIDVEHIYLYDRTTMPRLFQKHGFEVLSVFPVRNRYPLRYWCKMAPMPSPLKRALEVWLSHSAVGRWAVSLRAGNVGLIARSPGPENS